MSILNQPNPSSLVQVGTSVRFTCDNHDWFFDYSVPKDIVSYYYSTNIDSTTLTCNVYR